MHSIHEFDQDSMLHFETDDIVSRKSKEPVNFLHTTNDKNQINTQGFEKKSTNYEPYIATFEDSNEKDEATYYCPTFNNITSYKGYPTTTSSERILSRLDQSSNQNCTDSSASGQKNDAVYTTSTSNKPYQHLTHKNLGGGSDNTAFIFDSADDSQSLQDLRTSLKNSSPSASENHKPNRGHASFTARKSLRLDEGNPIFTILV
jgi:hypothetical protein